MNNPEHLQFSYQRVESTDILKRKKEKATILTVVSHRGRYLPACLEGRAPTLQEQKAFHQTVEEFLERPGSNRMRIRNSAFWLLRRIGFADAAFSGGQTINGHSEHNFRYLWLSGTIDEFRERFGEKLVELTSRE